MHIELIQRSIDAPGKIELERLDSGVKASTLDEVLEKLKEGSNYSASSYRRQSLKPTG